MYQAERWIYWRVNYLILNSIDKDAIENEETQRELKSQSMTQMIERIVDLNSELSPKELKELIADKLQLLDALEEYNNFLDSRKLCFI